MKIRIAKKEDVKQVWDIGNSVSEFKTAENVVIDHTDDDIFLYLFLYSYIYPLLKLSDKAISIHAKSFPFCRNRK